MDRFKILMDKRVIINRRVVADTDPAPVLLKNINQ